MNETVYYDTCAFIHFFETLDRTLSHKYSPLTRHDKGEQNIISPFVLEEYFHTHFTQKATTEAERKERIYRLTKIDHEYTGFYFDFASQDVNLKQLTKLFSSLFLAGTDLEIMTKKRHDGLLHSYDLLHLSYCMLARADIFLTSDSGFDKLFTTEANPKLQQRFEEFMSTYKLKKIAWYQNGFDKGCTDLIIKI